MSAILMWAGIAVIVITFGCVTEQWGPVVTMFVVSLLLPEDLFSIRE